MAVEMMINQNLFSFICRLKQQCV